LVFGQRKKTFLVEPLLDENEYDCLLRHIGKFTARDPAIQNKLKTHFYVLQYLNSQNEMCEVADDISTLPCENLHLLFVPIHSPMKVYFYHFNLILKNVLCSSNWTYIKKIICFISLFRRETTCSLLHLMETTTCSLLHLKVIAAV
jgi:hypothetical protein